MPAGQPMSRRKGYDIRRARREAERQRDLCGETLAEYRAKADPTPTTPGTGIPHVRCVANYDLFGAVYEHPAARQFNMGFPIQRRES